jgi:hypothetical protein
MRDLATVCSFPRKTKWITRCDDWTMLVSLYSIDIGFLSKTVCLNGRKRGWIGTMHGPPCSCFVIDGVGLVNSWRRGIVIKVTKFNIFFNLFSFVLWITSRRRVISVELPVRVMGSIPIDDTKICGKIYSRMRICANRALLLAYFPYFVQEVLGRTNRPLSLILHGPHWKRRVQQFFYCCVCIYYRGNVSTELLPSNDRGIFTEPFPSNDSGIHIQTHRLMWRIF